MILRVRNVELGGRILAETTLLVDAKGIRHGLAPLGGLNVVAGATGSGKTLLAEAVWLGVSWSLARLKGLADVVEAAYKASAVRPLSLVFEVELEDYEIPGGARLQAVIDGGLLEKLEVRPEATDKEALAYALAHIVSLPHTLKEAVYSSQGVGLVHLAPRELCDFLLPIIPPAAVKIGAEVRAVCYAESLGVEPGVVFIRKERDSYYTELSTGEISREVLRYYREALQALREEAKRVGVSLMPMAIIDDAFDGLDGRALSEAARGANASTWSLYATTHRTEAAEFAERVLALTYGLKASDLASKPSDFRFALVDINAMDYDRYVDFCEKVILGDLEKCKQMYGLSAQ